MNVESLRPEAAIPMTDKARLLNHLEVFADTVCTPSERDDEMSLYTANRLVAEARAERDELQARITQALAELPPLGRGLVADQRIRAILSGDLRTDDPDLNRPDCEDDPEQGGRMSAREVDVDADIERCHNEPLRVVSVGGRADARDGFVVIDRNGKVLAGPYSDAAVANAAKYSIRVLERNAR